MYKTRNEQKQELSRRILILFIGLVLLLSIGTIAYHFSEGWAWHQSLYYSTISLTSRGFSNNVPSNWFSVLFSVVYLIVGVAFMIFALSSLISFYITFYQEGVEKEVKRIMEGISSEKKGRKGWVELKFKEEKNGDEGSTAK